MEEKVEGQRFARRSKESHIDTIAYEICMLQYSLGWLNAHGPQHEPPEELWAMLECFLLHYRNLIHFLAGRESRGGLTMARPRTWAEGPYDAAEVQSVQTAAKTLYDQYSKIISTYLAHCTPQRSNVPTGWKPNEMYRDIEPVIERFHRAFQKPPASGLA